MAIKATVNSVPKITVRNSSPVRSTIRTVGVARISTANRLEGLLDVDASDAENDEILVYDSETGKYVVKPLPSINGGTF